MASLVSLSLALDDGSADFYKSVGGPIGNITLLTDAAAFEEAVLAGSHIDDIVVLRGWLGMLGQEDVLPSEILAAAQQQPTVRDFLDALGEEPLRELRGRVYCVQTEERAALAAGTGGGPGGELWNKILRSRGPPR